MLETAEHQKIEHYIEGTLDTIFAGTQKDIANHLQPRAIIDSAVRRTVSKLTPESKSILSSVYTMLEKQTLALPFYQDTDHLAAFYKRDILRDLNANFVFEVPDHIDYKESQDLLNKWTASGAIVITGSVISIRMKSLVPVAVSAVIVGIMLLLLKDKQPDNKQSLDGLVREYLDTVKQSLLSWVYEIEAYYDTEISKLEEGLK